MSTGRSRLWRAIRIASGPGTAPAPRRGRRLPLPWVRRARWADSRSERALSQARPRISSWVASCGPTRSRTWWSRHRLTRARAVSPRSRPRRPRRRGRAIAPRRARRQVRHAHVVAPDVRTALCRAADEPQAPGLEHDLKPPGSRSRDGKIEDTRPSCRQRLRIRCRELDAGDGPRGLAAHVPLPARSGPAPRRRGHAHRRSTGSRRRRRRGGDGCRGCRPGPPSRPRERRARPVGGGPRRAGPTGGSPCSRRRRLRSRNRRAGAVAGDGRDDLQEGVADRHDGVHQTELRHRGIAEADVDAGRRP